MTNDGEIDEKMDKVLRDLKLCEDDTKSKEYLASVFTQTEEDRKKLIDKGSTFLDQIGASLSEILNSDAVVQADDIEKIRDQQMEWIAAKLGEIEEKIDILLGVVDDNKKINEIFLSMKEK